MIIVITGGTGFVGQALIKKLLAQNYKIHLLHHKDLNPNHKNCKYFLWPNSVKQAPFKAFPKTEAYGIIHLSGSPILQWPWTKKIKHNIFYSRVERAKQLVQTVQKLTQAPRFFLSASAAGMCTNTESHLDNASSSINNKDLFLQQVCRHWEQEVLKISPICRSLIFRFGTIISQDSPFVKQHKKWIQKNIFPKIWSLKPFYLSWVSLTDVVNMIIWAIHKEQVRGIYNLVSPKPCSLNYFYKKLLKQYKFRGLHLPIPLAFIKFFAGEMAKNILISYKLFPKKALDEGFIFQKEDLFL